MELVQSVPAAPSGQRYRCNRVLRFRQGKRASQQSHASESLPVQQPQASKSHSQLVAPMSVKGQRDLRTDRQDQRATLRWPPNAVRYFFSVAELLVSFFFFFLLRRSVRRS